MIVSSYCHISYHTISHPFFYYHSTRYCHIALRCMGLIWSCPSISIRLSLQVNTIHINIYNHCYCYCYFVLSFNTLFLFISPPISIFHPIFCLPFNMMRCVLLCVFKPISSLNVTSNWLDQFVFSVICPYFLLIYFIYCSIYFQIWYDKKWIFF